ncbi:hypothetical protein [Hoeflea alexandrii]|nr:hypothetical protein [Hoeflea alexandrii]
MLVVIIEPVADLAVLAIAKNVSGIAGNPMFNGRLHTPATA